MINFDDPGFAIALVAILLGLRLALYVVQRLLDGRTESPAPALTPDEAVDAPLQLEATPAELPKEPGNLHFLTELLDSAIIAVVLVFLLIRPFVLQAFYIPSESMVPTLQKNDKLLATKFTYRISEPKRGDIVVFHAPRTALETFHQTYDPRHPTDYVKRVIGLPGDRVRIVAHEGVFINGARLHEPYIHDYPNYNFPVDDTGELTMSDVAVRPMLVPHIRGNELVVPKGSLFVLGDNRTSSHDSHIWGFISRKDLVGKAYFIFWPPNRWGFVR